MGDLRCFVIHGGMVGVADDGDGRNRIHSICREMRWHKLLAGLELDFAPRGSRSRPCEWPSIGSHDSCNHCFQGRGTAFLLNITEIRANRTELDIYQDLCLNISCWLRFHCSLPCESHPEKSLSPKMKAIDWASLSHIHRID